MTKLNELAVRIEKIENQLKNIENTLDNPELEKRMERLAQEQKNLWICIFVLFMILLFFFNWIIWSSI